jgi:hypothetical protein
MLEQVVAELDRRRDMLSLRTLAERLKKEQKNQKERGETNQRRQDKQQWLQKKRGK